jgi:adenosylhomocysteine nucleosidase
MAMKPLGIVTGLAREIACLHPADRAGGCVFAAGGSGPRAYATAKAWVAAGAVSGLVSFGIAGALDPALRPGEFVIAREVVDAEGGSWLAPAEWQSRIAAALPGARRGAMFGADRPVASPADKAALFDAFGALAVDMESHGVARAAAEGEIPFVAVRVVADPAQRALPRAALAGMDESGGTRIAPVLRALAARPADVPALLRVARDAGTAFAALKAAAAKAPLTAILADARA